MTTQEGTTQIHLRIPTPKADQLKELAHKKDRPLAQLVRDILNKYLDEKSELLLLAILSLLSIL